MAQNPPSFRYPFANLAKLPPEAREAHLATFNALTDIYQALAQQKQNSSTSTTTLNETVLGTSGTSGSAAGVKSFNSETGIVTYFPDLFFVNNQSSQTSYVLQTEDAGALVVLNDASPIAVGLNYTVGTNFACWVANYGTGTATLTPSMVPSGVTSTISYPGNLAAGSMPLPSGFAANLSFDGTNWWGIPIPITGGGGTITGVTAGTGLTGGGTSGTVTISLITPVAVVNGGSGTATPSLVPGTGISISGSWPNQTINSTVSSGVTTLNTLAGALSLTSTGATISITPSGSTINLEAPSVGGSANHFTGTGGATTFTLGIAPGSGSGAVAGKDAAGIISIIAGSGAGNGGICEIDFAISYSGTVNVLSVVFSPTNANAALLAGVSWAPVTSGGNTIGFTLGCTGSMAPSSGYGWSYVVIGF